MRGRIERFSVGDERGFNDLVAEYFDLITAVGYSNIKAVGRRFEVCEFSIRILSPSQTYGQKEEKCLFHTLVFSPDLPKTTGK